MWAAFLIFIPEVDIVEKIEVGNGLKICWYTQMARGNSTLKRGTSFQHYRTSLLPCWVYFGVDDRHHNLRRVSIS